MGNSRDNIYGGTEETNRKRIGYKEKDKGCVWYEDKNAFLENVFQCSVRRKYLVKLDNSISKLGTTSI